MPVFPNSIVQGDCLEVMGSISAGSIDMILCDLPYGVTHCAWDTVIPFEALWAQYKRIIKPNGAIVLTATQPFTSALVMSNPMWFKCSWIWVKTNVSGFANAKKQPLRTYEDVLVFYGKQPTYNPQGVTRMSRLHSAATTQAHVGKGLDKPYQQEFTNYPRNVLHVPSERGPHPTQKPVALFEYLIRTYTNEGDIVLDNCIGSGTTAVAALNTNRCFLGIELNPAYVKIAQDRIDAITNVPSLLSA